ncbi:MAG: hypothetical protein AAF501_17385 [Pseudomonadota bacterium]
MAFNQYAGLKRPELLHGIPGAVRFIEGADTMVRRAFVQRFF